MDKDILEYADFDVEAKFKEVAVQKFFEYIKVEEEYAGEPIVTKRAV